MYSIDKQYKINSFFEVEQKNVDSESKSADVGMNKEY